MAINLFIQRQNNSPLEIPLDDGQCVFILGANGTGKSSLMHAVYAAHHTAARRISAHRQTWFSSSSLALSPEQKRQTEQNIQGADTGAQARWKDDYSAQRANIAIYDLIDAENIRARQIAAAVDVGNMEMAKTLSQKDAPIKIINELLKLSGIPVEISVRHNEQVMASKSGGAAYSVAELSDGERNALLIAANVLTVPAGTLLLIDEPERHLHRSIISPLLTHLVRKRADCKFVVSTHDILLPMDNPSARTILARGCTYNGQQASHWDVDLIPANAPIEDSIKKDILGSRRKVVFVEGDDKSSLDISLYTLVFPGVSIVAKGGCKEVERAVAGIRSAPDLHWVQAFGIVDNDGQTDERIEYLRSGGVYAISVYMVESIYYHPSVQRLIAARHAAVTGDDAETNLAAATAGALAAVGPHGARLSARVIERKIRDRIDSMHPTQAEIAGGTPVHITVDVASELATERAAFEALVAADNVAGIICRYPVRDTAALTKIASSLGFQDRAQYENAVRKLVMEDASALTFVRSLFGTMYADVST
jgi:ABC-type cobalamin/Fe3+-siderophores transport system ATPase subunit